MVAPFAQARDVEHVAIDESDTVDIRVFPANPDNDKSQLLLGFPCDEGSSLHEESTAAALAEDGIEVWMPDMLSAFMLPDLRSSLGQIPSDALADLVERATRTGKSVYLIASGPDTELVLRAAARWESTHEERSNLAGAILLFPRLIAGEPEPGKAPAYVPAVGSTRLPVLVLEGERTPNRWGIGHLTEALEQGGSPVYAKLIPDVRGYFFKRDDPNMPESVATSQLSGLIKASLFYLGNAHR
jgi:hypothetical protein